MVSSGVGSHRFSARFDLIDALIISPSFLKAEELGNEDLVTNYLKNYTKSFKARAMVSQVNGKQRFCCQYK